MLLHIIKKKKAYPLFLLFTDGHIFSCPSLGMQGLQNTYFYT